MPAPRARSAASRARPTDPVHTSMAVGSEPVAKGRALTQGMASVTDRMAAMSRDSPTWSAR